MKNKIEPKQPVLKKKPTPKQEKFVEEYVATGNSAEAARRAGYSEKTARTIGSRLLTNVDISEFVRERQAEIMETMKLSSHAVTQGLIELASISPVDLIGAGGTIDLQEIKKRNLGRFVKKFKVTTTVKATGDRVEIVEIEGYSRIDAYSRLIEIYGMKQQPRENNETIEKVVKAFQDWLEDNPQATKQEQSMWAQKFAESSGVDKAELAKRVGLKTQEINQIQ
jgi:hypothetical protein